MAEERFSGIEQKGGRLSEGSERKDTRREPDERRQQRKRTNMKRLVGRTEDGDIRNAECGARQDASQ